MFRVILFLLMMTGGMMTTLEAAETGAKPLVIFDAHCDSILDVLKADTNSLSTDNPFPQQADIPKWKRGGINVVGLAMFVNPARFTPEQTPDRVDVIYRRIQKEIADSKGQLVQCRTADDAQRAAESGKIAAIVTIEGGQVLNGDPANLQRYADMGVRSMNLVWNKDLPWVGSVMDEQQTSKSMGRGLNETGVKIVKEMNRLGMVVDLSHASDQAVTDTLKITTKPVIASHSCARSISPYPRNLPDEYIQGIASTGGVVGVTFGPYFVSDNPVVGDLVELDKMKSADLKTTIHDVVRHIKYMTDLVGVDHVGIGSDFDGFATMPAELENAGQMGTLVKELCKIYSDDEVRKIMGLNMLRVYRANESK